MSAQRNGSGDGAHNGMSYEVPRPRAEWLRKRREEAARLPDENFSQMHYARRGVTTEEMNCVALKEKLAPEEVREEVAAGRMIIPANKNHLRYKLEPMCIGRASLTKINANLGASPVCASLAGGALAACCGVPRG